MANYLSGEELLKVCPWDSSHRLAPRRFLTHLATCPSKGRNPNLVQCIYDLSHVYQKGCEAEHMSQCAGFVREVEDKMMEPSPQIPSRVCSVTEEPKFSVIPSLNKGRRRSTPAPDEWDNDTEEDCNSKKKLLFQNAHNWREICFDPKTGVLKRQLDKVSYSRLSTSEKNEYHQASLRAPKEVHNNGSSSTSSGDMRLPGEPVYSPQDFRLPVARSAAMPGDRIPSSDSDIPRLAIGRGQRK